MDKKYDNLILIISILIALFTIFASVFFFKVIQNKNEHTSRVLLTLSERMNDQKNAEILKNKLDELNLIEKEINDYFVDPNKIDTFVDYLEKLGIDNNTELIIKNVEILSKKKNTIAIKVLITGDFTNVMKVIYALENISYNVNLNQAFVNKESKTTIGVNETDEEVVTSFWQADLSFEILTLPKEEIKKDE